MVQQLLLLGQLIFVVLIYVFVWRVVRGARGDLLGAAGGRRSMASLEAQESTIIPAADALAARRAAGMTEPRIVVHSSEVLRPGVPFTIGGGLTLGRADSNDVVLEDSVVSSHHLRIVPPGTVVDDGSTNGTFLNGQRIAGRAALRSGDQLQVGSTIFRFEGPR